jgi:rare lipoprotein A (peptidoglycan hydrolase)
MALAVVASSLCVAAFATDGLASTGATAAAPSATAVSDGTSVTDGPGGTEAGQSVDETGQSAPRYFRRHRHRRAHASMATWFGPGLYGRRTACGQVLTRHVIGLAHKTLPCGTLVELSYRGHHLVAPVIDRGPYAPGVTWDLTTLAARALGVSGTARLRAKVIGRVPNTPTLGMVGQPKSTPSGGSEAESGPLQVTGVTPAPGESSEAVAEG